MIRETATAGELTGANGTRDVGARVLEVLDENPAVRECSFAFWAFQTFNLLKSPDAMRKLLVHRETPCPSKRLATDIAECVRCVTCLPVVFRGVRQNVIQFRLVDGAKPLAPCVRQLCGVRLYALQERLLLLLERESAEQVLQVLQ